MKYLTQIIAILAVILMIASIAGCSNSANTTTPTGKVVAQEQEKTVETIKIGAVQPLTGDMSTIGQSVKRSVELAAEEINNNGGINGRKIEVVFEDGKCNGKDSVNAGNKLINIDKVNYIIGGICSSETLAIAPLAEQGKVVQISTGSSNPTVTDAGDYIFRVYPSDSYQGVFAAEYIYNTLGIKEVVLMNEMTEWAGGLSKEFEKRYTELDGKIILHEEFVNQAKDLRAELSKVKAADPELIVLYAMTESAANGIKQAKELGITAPFIGGDAWGDPTLWKNTKGYADGSMYTDVDADAPESFTTRYKAKHGQDAEITIGAPQAYDATYIIANAIALSGDNPEKVKNFLYTMSSYKGVSGNIQFDRNGDLTVAKYKVKVIHDGEPVVKQ